MDLHIPHDAYYKARKMFGVFIALLLAWVVIGIKVEEIDLAGAVLHINRQQWIPWVFVAMVLYGAYRYNHKRTICASNIRDKLAQTDKGDRDKEAIRYAILLHKIELYVLNILAATAIVLQVYKVVKHIGS